VKVLVPITATLLTYFALSLVWAEYGILAHSRLSAHRDRLEQNIEKLEERRRELRAETKELRTDADRIRVEARRLGYFGENEGLVRIESWSVEHEPSSPGALVKARPEPPNHQAIIRAAAASAGLFALFIMLIVDQRRSQSMRRASK
jgi:cell division protein FtsB